MSHRDMTRSIPKDSGVEFQEMPPQEVATILVEWPRTVHPAEYPKSLRGPKKPKLKKQSGAKIQQAATLKVLEYRIVGI